MISAKSSKSVLPPTKIGPLLVTLGAVIWATDGVLRSQVTALYSPLLIVYVTHILCLPITIPMALIDLSYFKELKTKDWFAFLFLGLGSSILGMVLFTEAFTVTTNYNIPILLQKTQPLLAIIMAHFFLKETLGRHFWIWAALAFVGVYLLSFRNVQISVGLDSRELKTAILSISAAAIWAAGLIVGKDLSRRLPFHVVTSGRYLMGTAFLTLIMINNGLLLETYRAITNHFLLFTAMAIVPNFIGLLIYYRGLHSTKASVATICELAFPIGAILMNWLFLGSTLDMWQALGACLMIGAVTAMAYDRKV